MAEELKLVEDGTKVVEEDPAKLKEEGPAKLIEDGTKVVEEEGPAKLMEEGPANSLLAKLMKDGTKVVEEGPAIIVDDTKNVIEESVKVVVEEVIKVNLPKKRKCHFNESLNMEFPFLIPINNERTVVQCSVCDSTFSVANGGKSSITIHIQSQKHTNALAAISPLGSAFLKPLRDNNIVEYKPEFEAVWSVNELAKNFRYIGHCEASVILMECITLLSPQDEELKLCGVRIRTRQGRYSNLARHKEVVHRNFTMASLADVSSASSEKDLGGEVHIPFSPNVVIETSEQSFIGNCEDEVSVEYENDDKTHDEECDRCCCVSPVKKCKRDVKQKQFDCDVVAMIADGVPSQFTTYNSFKNLIQNLDSEISIKGKQFYLNKLKLAVDNQVRPALEKLISDCEDQGYHFSFDIWPLKEKILLGITIHFITKDWRHVERTLAFRFIKAYQNIEEEFKRCLTAYKLSLEKIGTIVIDNGPLMLRTLNLNEILSTRGFIKEGDTEAALKAPEEVLKYLFEGAEISEEEETLEKFCYCENHILENMACNQKSSTVIHELMAVVKEAIVVDFAAKKELWKIDKIIKFFRRSERWFTILKSKLRQNVNLQEKSQALFKSTNCGWTTLVNTLQLFSDGEIYDAVHGILLDACLGNVNKSTEYILSSNSKIVELTYFLNILDNAIECLSSREVTAHKVIFVIVKMFKSIKELDTWYYHKMKRHLLERLKEKFEVILQCEDLIIATFCDPRQKLRLFDDKSGRGGSEPHLNIINRTEAENVIRHHYEMMEMRHSEQLQLEREYMRGDVSVNKNNDIFEDLDAIAPLEQQDAKVPFWSEIEMYLNEPQVSKDTEVLQFWKHSAYRYPVLSKLAMKYFATPISSKILHRDFSSMVQIEEQVLYREHEFDNDKS